MQPPRQRQCHTDPITEVITNKKQIAILFFWNSSHFDFLKESLFVYLVELVEVEVEEEEEEAY